jgi:hypothetical protein
MDQLEDKLGAILNNPQLMQNIMSMAQSLGQNAAPQETGPAPDLPNFDPALLAKLGALAGQGRVDNNQQALLTALHPYLSSRKVEKLEKAMRAAKMARMASSFLGQGGLSLLTGR